ncbi:MAG: hypothetical protein KIT31_37050, partial [Deltaproteobacteria bacterium]|nr:hypothetical protein [Deltaproteobacteria bacterium]
DEGIELMAAPVSLATTARAPSKAEAFRLRFTRRRDEAPKGYLEIEILDTPSETFRIPFAIRNILPEPPSEAAVAAEKNATRQAAEQRKMEETTRAAERMYDEHHEYTSGHEHGFDKARADLARVMGTVANRHQDGVRNARAAVTEFRRVPVKPSLIEKLAPAALEIAFAAVAGGVGKRVEAVLAATELGAAAKGFIVDGIKQVIKTGGKEVGPTAGGPESGKPPASSSATHEFFEAQHQHLDNARSELEGYYVNTFADTLRPMFAVRPGELKEKPSTAMHARRDRAIAILKALTAAFKEEHKTAAAVQQRESTRAWVSYVGASQLASGGGTPGSMPHVRFDGILDFRGSASEQPPYRARVEGMRLLGISREALATLPIGGALRDLGIPIRLVLELDNTRGGTVTLLRAPDGTVSFSDTDPAATSGQRPPWLARRLGVRDGLVTEEAQRRSAEQVLRETLLERPLLAFQIHYKLEIDDAGK